jgi:hypothetical protein
VFRSTHIQNITARERMNRRLLIKRGYALYRERSHIFERVFGQIKDCPLNLERSIRRGQSATTCEWNLCGHVDLMKVFRHTIST